MAILSRIQQLQPWASLVHVVTAIYRVVGWFVILFGAPVVGFLMLAWAYVQELPTIEIVMAFMCGFIFTVLFVWVVQIALDSWRLWKVRKTRIEPLTDHQLFDEILRQEELKTEIESTRRNASLSLLEKDKAIAEYEQEISEIEKRISSVAWDIGVFIALNYITTHRLDISLDEFSDHERTASRLRKAMNSLRQQAADGAVVIYGRNFGYSPSIIEPINADFWKRNKFEVAADSSDGLSIRTASSKKGAINSDDESYKEMHVSKKRVMELWP